MYIFKIINNKKFIWQWIMAVLWLMHITNTNCDFAKLFKDKISIALTNDYNTEKHWKWKKLIVLIIWDQLTLEYTLPISLNESFLISSHDSNCC